MSNYHIIIDTRDSDLGSFYNDIKGTRYEYIDKLDIAILSQKKTLKEDDQGNPQPVIEEIDPEIEFLPGHRYLVMGPRAYSYVKDHIHLGPRGEGFYDLTKMEYLLTRSGAIFKFVYVNYKRYSDFISRDQYNKLAPNIEILQKRLKWAELVKGTSKRTGKDYFMLVYYKLEDVGGEIAHFLDAPDLLYEVPQPKFRKIVKTVDEINEAFDFLMAYEKEDGLDYETNGFPFDQEEFYHMGVGISTQTGECYYFDMDGYQRLAGRDWEGREVERMPWEEYDPEPWKVFDKRYKEFLDKNAEKCYTYNVSFEQRATYLMHGVLYFFHEGSAINKLDSLVKKNFSLKYTAMRVIHNSSWDDDFEWLSDVIGQLMEYKDPEGRYSWDTVFYTSNKEEVQLWTDDEVNVNEEGQRVPTREAQQRLNCETKFYQDSDIWREINERYPGYEREFAWFIENRWGQPFACIPPEILGQYCCLDSFWTVLLHEYGLRKYSEKAWDCFDNNLRMGALLGIHGIPLDEDIRQVYGDMATVQILTGLLNFAKWWLNYQQLIIPFNVGVLPTTLRKIWEQGKDPYNLNEIIDTYYDPLGGIMTNKIAEVYGWEIATWIAEECQLWSLDDNIKNKEIIQKYNNFLKENYVIEYREDDCSIEWFGTILHFDCPLNLIQEKVHYAAQERQVDWLRTQVIQEKPQYVFKFLNIDGTYEDKDGWGKGDTIQQWIKDCIFNFNSDGNFGDMEFAIFNYYGPMLVESLDWDEDTQFTSDPNLKERFLSKDLSWWNEEYKNTFLYDEEHEEKDEETGEVTKWVEHVTRLVSIYNQSKLFDYHDRAKKWIDKWIEQGTLHCTRRKCDEKGNPLMNEKGTEWILEDFDFDVNKSEEIKRYKRSGDVLTCFLQLAADHEGVVYRPSEKVLDEGEIERIFPIPELEEIYWELPEQTSTSGSGYWLCLKGFCDRILEDYSTRKCFEKIYLNKEVDILDKNIAGIMMLQYSFVLFRKYDKVMGTYLNGQFTKYTHTVNKEDQNLICTERWYDENKPELKVFSPFKVCEKQSKRWSAPTHTIPSKSETKRCINTPPGYLLSYFDISGAEVRTVAYTSKAKFFMDCYAQGKDVYIEAAKIVEPGEDLSYYKRRRGAYKQILLGRMFGMGDELMAEMTESTLEESIERGNNMFKLMPEVEALIQEKANYCTEHEGICETILGDKMVMEGKRRDQWARLGINQVIQGFTAIALADGFFHNIYVSYKTGEIKIRPVNVVHDSSQNLFETKKLFEIIPYYDKNMREYLLEKYGINWAFDTEAGVNYYDMVDLEQIDPGKMTLKGTYTALRRFLDKLTADGLDYWISSIQNDNKEELELTNDQTYAVGFEPDIPAWGFKQSVVEGKVEARFEIDKAKYCVTINKGVKP